MTNLRGCGIDGAGSARGRLAVKCVRTAGPGADVSLDRAGRTDLGVDHRVALVRPVVVGAGSAVDPVVAGAALERVGAAHPAQDVVAGRPGERVGPGIADQSDPGRRAGAELE